MPTISMFYGIIIRMLFMDVQQHHLPLFMWNTKAKRPLFQFRTAICWRAISRPRSCAWCRRG